MNIENQYLNEEKYQKNKSKIKKVGKILLIVGAILLVIGIASLIFGFLSFGGVFDKGITSAETGNIDNSQMAEGVFGSFGLFTLGMFIIFAGSSLLMAGGVAMIIAHGREINEFSAQSTIPVAKEAVNQMAPSAGTVAKEVTKGIKEGLDDKKED